jgi:lysophospholipase L1-like esterase
MGSSAWDTIRILCLGDSLTEGYTGGGVVFEPYSEAFEALLKKCGWLVDVVTDGESGDQVTAGSFQWRMSKRCKSLISSRTFIFIMRAVPGV